MIVMGVLAMGATLFGTLVTILDWIIICYIIKNKKIGHCCSKLGKDIKNGELLPRNLHLLQDNKKH